MRPEDRRRETNALMKFRPEDLMDVISFKNFISEIKSSIRAGMSEGDYGYSGEESQYYDGKDSGLDSALDTIESELEHYIEVIVPILHEKIAEYLYREGQILRAPVWEQLSLREQNYWRNRASGVLKIIGLA